MQIQEASDYRGLIVNRDNPSIKLLAKKGHAKSLSAESIAESFHETGYIVISVTDVKKEFEQAYAMFEPQEEWHLETLDFEGKIPSNKKVEIYHPFTFNIPTNIKLPKINFFTIPLKSLNRTRISFLIEKNREDDTTRLLNSSINDLGDNGTIYDLMHLIKKKVQGTKSKYLGRSITRKEDPFFTGSGVKASKTNLQEIQSHFEPFLRDYFLTPKNFALNLAVNKIYKNQKAYHILTNTWIEDIKREFFSELNFLDEIMKRDNLERCKHPILFLFEELAEKLPYRSEGFRSFYADYVRGQLLTMRNKGRGCASISTTQIWFGMDEKIRESEGNTLIGNIGGISDLDRVAKALRFSPNEREMLSEMPRGYYILKENKDKSELFKVLLPSHCHAEARYNFVEMYKKFYYERKKKEQQLETETDPKKIKELEKFIEMYDQLEIVSYKEITDKVSDHFKTIQKEFKQKMRRAQSEQLQDIKQEEKQKAKEERQKEKTEEWKSKYLDKKESSKEGQMQQIYKLKKENPKLSVREIAEIMNMKKSTVGNYLKIMREKAEQEERLPKMKGAEEQEI